MSTKINFVHPGRSGYVSYPDTPPKRKMPKKIKAKKMKIDLCEDCGNKLPPPVQEERGGGYSEPITYCPCGAVYTGGA